MLGLLDGYSLCPTHQAPRGVDKIENPIIGLDIGFNQLRVALCTGDRASAVSPTLVTLPDRLTHLPLSLVPPGRREGQGSGEWQLVSAKATLHLQSNELPDANNNAANDTPRDPIVEMAERMAQLHRYLEIQQAERRRYVIAVPTQFSERQRAVWRDAAWKAGWEHVRLVQDTLPPLLHLLSPGGSPPLSDQGGETSQGNFATTGIQGDLLVCNWGASGISLAIYRVDKEGSRLLAQSWDWGIGGVSLDFALLSTACQRMGTELRSLLPETMEALIAQIAPAKATLAQGIGATLPLPPPRLRRATPPPALVLSPDDLRVSLSQPLQTVQGLLARLYSEANIAGVAHVVATGGMTAIPAVQQLLRAQVLASATGQIHFLPSVVVALGAALYGRTVTAEEWERSYRPANLTTLVVPPPTENAQTEQGRAPQQQNPPPTEEDQFIAQFVDGLRKAMTSEAAGEPLQASAHFDRLMQDVNKLRRVLGQRTTQRLMAAGKWEEAFHLLHIAGRTEEAFTLMYGAWQRAPRNRDLALALARACYFCGETAYNTQNYQRTLQFVQAGLKALADSDTGGGSDAQSVRGDRLEIEEVGRTHEREGRVAICRAQLWNLEGCMAVNRRDWLTAKDRFMRAVNSDPSVASYQENLKMALGNLRQN